MERLSAQATKLDKLHSHPSFKKPESVQVILNYQDSLQKPLSVDNRIDYSHSTFGENSSFEEETLNSYPKRNFEKLTWQEDFYEGIVVNRNLHGWGFYSTQDADGKRFFYDAQFYINKLEGYGEIFYDNGSYFQGLFKEQLRYGPGVVTYPDGSQDVGFWHGFKLTRLTCVVGNDLVPKIASTQVGKSKLMCNRYLVPLNPIEEDQSEDKLLKNLDQVCNIDIRNPRSVFFHKQFYDNQFFRGEEGTINVVIEDGDHASSLLDVKVDSKSDDWCEERARCLRQKIAEVNDTWETFYAIKTNLLRKVKRCGACCEENLGQEENSEDEVTMSNVDDSGTDRSLSPNTQSGLSTPTNLDSYLDTFLTGKNSIFQHPEPLKIDAIPTLIEPSLEETALVEKYTCLCEGEEITDDLQYMEDQLDKISKQELYFRNIRDELQKKLEKLLENQEKKIGEKFQYKEVKVKELWAWNNEQTLVEMQRHCFKHRNSEDMVNFDVANLILGERKLFGPTGPHEDLCQRFLLACSKGDKTFVKKCLRENLVNPNLTDARGNSALFFATSKNRQHVISFLINCGAKIDQLNDEQLTPLSMALLKYICEKNNCEDWEKAFLPPSATCKVQYLPKWYQVKSFLSMPSVSSLDLNSQDQDSPEKFSNHRIINLFQRISNMPKRGSLRKSLLKTSYIFDLNCLSPNEKQTEDEEQVSKIDEQLKSTYLTITTLLDYGANPNACEVPYPPLFLSLFTENPDIVKQLIRTNADLKLTIEEDLTCLHIAACLPPTENNIEICAVLAKHKCDPNQKTQPTHWEDKMTTYTGQLAEIIQIQDCAKNPLHLLCMRTDFENDRSDYFCSVSKILINAKIDITDKCFGHTPLSLAVLSGNTRLAQCLLKSNLINPYEPLNHGMGNVMTLFALKRFENALPIEQCKAMLTALADINVNVLYGVEDAENAIVFAEDFDDFIEKLISDQTEKKPGKDKAKPKAKKKDKHAQCEVVKEFLKVLGRQTIVKQIQLRVVQMLIMFIEEGIPIDETEICQVLASEFLAPEDVIKCVELIFVTRTFGKDRLKAHKIKDIIEFVKSHKKVVKTPAKKSKKDKDNKSKDSSSYNDEAKYSLNTIDLLSTDAEYIKKRADYVRPAYLSIPGLDDLSKYKVCFHCLRGKDKPLKICPRCQMVYFCSAQCNKSNLKVKTQHGCNIFFYEMSDIQVSQLTKNVCLEDLVQKVEKNCEVRLEEVRHAKLVEQEEKLLKMWRADTYGTKFMHLMRLMEEAERKTTGQYVTWNMGLLKSILERSYKTDPGDISGYTIDNLLLKLKRNQHLSNLKEEASVRPKQSLRRSTLGGGGSSIKSIIFEDFAKSRSEDVQQELMKKDARDSGSSEKPAGKQPKSKPPSKAEPPLVKVNKDFSKHMIKYAENGSKLPKELSNKSRLVDKDVPVLKRLKKVPSRYRRFIEIVSLYFPEVEFSFWLLPYACYSEGQMYYKFCTNFFRESYSLT